MYFCEVKVSISAFNKLKLRFNKLKVACNKLELEKFGRATFEVDHDRRLQLLQGGATREHKHKKTVHCSQLSTFILQHSQSPGGIAFYHVPSSCCELHDV